MGKPRKKSELTREQARLVDLIRKLYFGRIENLHVAAGQPIFDPVPRVTQKRKSVSAGTSSGTSEKQDFELKAEVLDLLAAIHSAADGTQISIEVRFGLPANTELEIPDPISWIRG